MFTVRRTRALQTHGPPSNLGQQDQDVGAHATSGSVHISYCWYPNHITISEPEILAAILLSMLEARFHPRSVSGLCPTKSSRSRTRSTPPSIPPQGGGLRASPNLGFRQDSLRPSGRTRSK